MANGDEESVLKWRVGVLEEQLSKLTKDVAVLNRIMYMAIGAMVFVQVVLPLLHMYGGLNQ